jgi:nucleoside-diphosphate-sugar epimerase
VKNRRSFAYVGNVVGAIRALLDSSTPGSDAFYVSDNNDLSTPELVGHVARSLGKRPRLIPVPPGMLRGLARTGGLLSRIGGLHLSTDSVTAVLGSLFVDTSSLREMTGYSPPFSVEKGMSVTATWFQDRNAGTAR